MSIEITPDSAPDPDPAAPYTIADGDKAAGYIEQELVRSRKGLTVTRVITTLLVLSALIETFYVVGNLQKYLQPKAAADIVQGEVTQHLDDQQDNLREAMAQRLPILISQVPDQVIQQMPAFRESLETRLTGDLNTYAASSSKNLDAQMTDYLSAHKDEVKQALADGDNTAAIHQLGNGLTSQFIQTLKTTSDGGETLQSKLDTSLAQLQQVKRRMDHLASDKNLTPEDKRTRHMIALMVRSANLHAPKVNVIQAVTTARNAASTGMKVQ